MRLKTDHPNQLIARLDVLASIIERISLFVSVIFGGSMVVIVIAGVIARYAMRNPFAWTEEASRFLMIWMVLLGMSVVTRNRENLCVEFLVIKLPVLLQRIIKLINELLVLGFLYLLVVEGFKMAIKAKVQMVPSLGITMYYPLLSIPVGGLLTMIQLGLQMFIDLIMWKTKTSPYKLILE